MTRWVRFRCADSRAGFGALEAESIVEYVGDLFDRPILSGATIARDRVKLLAPCMPSKIVALWNNFHALAAKLEKKAPVHPLFLIKPASSVIVPNDGPTHFAFAGTTKLLASIN